MSVGLGDRADDDAAVDEVVDEDEDEEEDQDQVEDDDEDGKKALIGKSVGTADGTFEGGSVGSWLGLRVGMFVGIAVGVKLGRKVGTGVIGWHTAACISGAFTALVSPHFTVTPHVEVLLSYSQPSPSVFEIEPHIRWHAATETAAEGSCFHVDVHV